MRGSMAAWAMAVGLLTAPAPAAADAGAGCSWYAGSNPDAVNVAYPDESASYWGTAMLQIPETGLVIRGRFPHARYFSIHAYDPALRPVGAIGDAEIEPETGVNPFAGENAAGGDGTYTVRIVPRPRPASPEPNTIYAGAMFEGHPNPGGIVLYRVYVSDDPADPAGGVGLPDVSFAAGGSEARFGQCDVTGALPDLGANRFVRELDYPDWAPRTPPTRDETNPPRWNKFFGYGTLLRQVPDNPVTPAVTPRGGGFLSNVHNDYVSAAINRTHGEVVVMRAKMPDFPDTRAGEAAAAPHQLRYWSICQNETVSQRYVACVADHDAMLDSSGRATIVISDPGDRPANARAESGVNWLPWGGLYPEGRIIYRQMVAAPGFGEAIARISEGEAVRPAMGEYYPVIAYCTKERFEQEGADGCLEGL